MKNCRIFCDAYGTYVVKSRCRNCTLRRDCVKIRLPKSKNHNLKQIEYFK